MLPQLLAHPLTQLYVTGNDQYPLSYLEAISISKSTSGINLLAIQEQQERQKQQQEDGAVKSKGVVGEQESKIDKKPEVDDDDDGVGFRVTFVSLRQCVTERTGRWASPRLPLKVNKF